MVDAVVAAAIDKLGYFIQEVNIRIGVKDAIIWLRDELSFLQVSVIALETEQQTGHIRLWIDNVKDVANGAIIILERFSTHQEEHAAPKQGFLDRMRSCVYICKKEADLYDIGKEIESLKERVVGIKNRREDYKIDDILASLSQSQKRRKRIKGLIPFENEVDVVGFEDDFKTLLGQLVREDPSFRVISIHGMGGLGKTTLARKLYDSSELSHYQCRSFVCVSQEYDIKDVLRRMIKSVEGPKHELGIFLQMEELDLLEYLRNLLGGVRFLVVIDDLWDMEAWKIIKRAFPEKKKGSRVIITTRNKDIARIVDDRCFVHELRLLREDEGWQLFSKKAEPTRNLEKLGRAMVKKCRGLPLAIVVLSGLLLHKESYGDWLDVKDHLWRKLKEDSCEIQDILSLSYNDLPFGIRQCFLYLARFPEDHTFEVDKLMKLWIAEEFISEADKGDGVVLEDVAKDYLNELINRNMIQIARLRLNEEVEECRVHDLVRDLAIEKAREHKLLGIFDSSKQHSSSISLLQGQPRHAIYNGIGEYLKLLWPSSDFIKRNLRSLALINETDILFKLQDIKLMYTRFKYLKVLDLTSVKSEGIPEEIGDLVLLKFLGLMQNENIFAKALVIPPTISKLKKLQTLCGLDSNGYEFPEEMCELKELRHLNFKYTSQRHVRGSFKIGSHQTKLQTLGRIWYEDWILIDTINLTNLRTLIIMVSSFEEYDGYSWESITNLTSLQSIVILFDTRSFIPSIKPLSYCDRLKTVYLYGKLKDSSELSFLPDSVTCLTLACSGFTQDPMPTLGSLSNLNTLDLTDVFIGKKMLCSHDSFPSLKFFRLSRIYKLEELHVEDGALPSLKGFGISHCSNLRMITPRLKNVSAIPDIFAFSEY